MLSTPTPESSVRGSLKCTLLSQAEDIHTGPTHTHSRRRPLRPLTDNPDAELACRACQPCRLHHSSPDETAATPLCTAGPLMTAPCRHGEGCHCKTSYESLYGSASLNPTGRGYISFLLVAGSWLLWCREEQLFPQIDS